MVASDCVRKKRQSSVRGVFFVDMGGGKRLFVWTAVGMMEGVVKFVSVECCGGDAG